MNAERFKLLADAYGANLDRWPANERAAAVAFMGEDPDAPVWLADAESLDRLLGAAPSPAPSAVLREEIIASAPRAKAGWMRRGAWMSGAGLGAACVLGVVVGANLSGLYLEEATTDVTADVSTVFDGTAYFDALEISG